MGSSTDKHQFRSTACTVFNNIKIPHLYTRSDNNMTMRALSVLRAVLSLFFPQRAHPGLDSGAAHPCFASHRPSAARSDHLYVFKVRVSLFLPARVIIARVK